MTTEPAAGKDRLVVVPAGYVVGASTALRFLLLMHGFGGLVVGTLLAGDNPISASVQVIARIPLWPMSWGVTLAAGGFLIVVGRLSGHFTVTRIGVVIQLLWHCTSAAGFALAVPHGGSRYAVAIYVMFVVALAVHLRWLAEHDRWRP